MNQQRSRTDGGRRAAVATVGLLAIVMVLIASPGARAIETDTFRLEPHPLRVDGYERRSFDFEADPGITITDAVRLTNKTDEPRRFRLVASDAERDPDSGAVAVGSRGQEPVGMGSWIELETNEIDLPPHGSQVVGFTFQRPDDRDVAGSGAIVAEELQDVEGGGVDVVYRLAIIVQLGGRTPDLVVNQPDLGIPLAMMPSEGTLSSTVRNDTLAPVRATVRFSVTSLTGRTWMLDPEEVVIPPGEEHHVDATWASVPRWGGVMRPQVEVDWARGNVAVAGDRGLHPPLWLLALAILAVGVRGLREMWSRRKERRPGETLAAPAPDPDVLRGRLIEAALWLHAAGRDAPAELRETTATEAQAVAVEARRAKDARDIERAARSLAAFAHGLDDGDGTAERAAHDFDDWFRRHQDDPRVKEHVRS